MQWIGVLLVATSGLQQTYLKASNPDDDDNFGTSIAVSGDTLVVGAPLEDSSATGVNGDQDDDGAPESGAVYVFVRDGTTWSQQAYVKASNTGAGDRFGASVSICGDTLVIGAFGEDSNATGVNGDENDNSASYSGAVYVFERTGSSWSQVAYLKASTTLPGAEFGSAVAVSEDTIVVGAPEQTKVYVFVRSGTTWSQQALLNLFFLGPDAGEAVAVSGERLVIGSPRASDAIVYVRSGSTWTREADLSSTFVEFLDSFGMSLAMSDHTVLVGAPGEDSNASGINGNQSNNLRSNSGAGFVFVFDGTSWREEAYLKASNPGVNDAFGRAVALDGDTAVLGALLEDSSATGANGPQGNNDALDSGAVYVFVRTGAGWSQATYLKASNTGPGDHFGSSVALSNATLAVGAYHEDSGSSGVNGDPNDDSANDAGAAWAFELCLEARAVFRNAGTNPASYAASPPVIGTTFTATVDNGLAAQQSSFLFAFESATSLSLGGGQTLLCRDEGRGELFTGLSLLPTASSAGVDSFALAIPNDPLLCGTVLHSQALQLGNPPFVLSNALDLTFGAF